MRFILNFAARVWLLLAALSLFLVGCATPAPPPQVAATVATVERGKPPEGSHLAPSPVWWLQEIDRTAKPIYAGQCEIQPLGLDNVRCRLYADALHGLGWVVLSGEYPANDAPTVILMVNVGDMDTVIVAWCKPKFCPKGVI